MGKDLVSGPLVYELPLSSKWGLELVLVTAKPLPVSKAENLSKPRNRFTSLLGARNQQEKWEEDTKKFREKLEREIRERKKENG
nr:hypothetical protein [Tanacetum cinerariifolium]